MSVERSKTVSHALNLLIGKGRRYSVDAVADATGIPAGSIYAMKAGTYDPRCAELLVLCGVLGPAFTNSILAEIGQGGVHEISDTAADANATIAKMANGLDGLCGANAVGRIDHKERRDLALG